jgi:hypothetical protein
MPTDSFYLETPHIVYRFFDKEDKLLYIGCSTFPPGRKFGHHAKPWYREIARMTTEQPRPRQEALAAEAAAIALERPPHNYQHQKGKQRQAKLAKEAWEHLAALGRRLMDQAKRYRCARCGARKPYNRVAYCKPCEFEIHKQWSVANRPGYIGMSRYTKLCSCGQPRYVHPHTGRVDVAYCQACKRAYNRKYREAHPK